MGRFGVGLKLNGTASCIVSVWLSFVCLSKYYFKETDSIVITASCRVPPIYLAILIKSLSGISAEIEAFFFWLSYLEIWGFLKPLHSFGRQTTVRKEHQNIFNGSITNIKIYCNMEMWDVNFAKSFI